MVELLGGGLRIPFVQEAISAALGLPLGRHMNSDEAMCLGATLLPSAKFRLAKGIPPFALTV